MNRNGSRAEINNRSDDEVFLCLRNTSSDYIQILYRSLHKSGIVVIAKKGARLTTRGVLFSSQIIVVYKFRSAL